MHLFHYHLVTSRVREVEARYLGKLGFELVARHGRIGEDLTSFEADSRAQVQERAEWVRSQPVEIESEPQEYSYTPGYFAFFFYDPDGMKLEIVHVPGLVAA